MQGGRCMLHNKSAWTNLLLFLRRHPHPKHWHTINKYTHPETNKQTRAPYTQTRSTTGASPLQRLIQFITCICGVYFVTAVSIFWLPRANSCKEVLKTRTGLKQINLSSWLFAKVTPKALDQIIPLAETETGAVTVSSFPLIQSE